jgi:hypothetical protein
MGGLAVEVCSPPEGRMPTIVSGDHPGAYGVVFALHLGQAPRWIKAKADWATAQKRQRRQNPRKRQSAYRSIRSVFARLQCDLGTYSFPRGARIERHHWSSNSRSTVMAEGLSSEAWRAQCRRSFPCRRADVRSENES